MVGYILYRSRDFPNHEDWVDGNHGFILNDDFPGI
jgi:hypothetical protein